MADYRLYAVSFGWIVCLYGNYAKARADERSLAAGEHIITVHDDGRSKGFITKKQTLREALAEATIKLDRNDRTEPNIDERLVANSYKR